MKEDDGKRERCLRGSIFLRHPWHSGRVLRFVLLPPLSTVACCDIFFFRFTCSHGLVVMIKVLLDSNKIEILPSAQLEHYRKLMISKRYELPQVKKTCNFSSFLFNVVNENFEKLLPQLSLRLVFRLQSLQCLPRYPANVRRYISRAKVWFVRNLRDHKVWSDKANSKNLSQTVSCLLKRKCSWIMERAMDRMIWSEVRWSFTRV